MNSKLIWLVLFIIVLIISIILYRNMGAETRDNVIFFGSIILVCLVAGLLIASGIKYFFSLK